MSAKKGIVYCANNHTLVGVVIDEELPHSEIQNFVKDSFQVRDLDLVCNQCNSRKFWVALLDEKFAEFRDAVPGWVDVPPHTSPACLVLFPKDRLENRSDKN